MLSYCIERKENKMAYQKKTATVTEDTKKETSTVAEEKVSTKTPRKYEKEDVIPCKSITNGKLLVDGDKSGNLYRWADYGDVEEVEYQDLIYMVRSHKACVLRPRFIIQDKDFVEQHSELKELYNSLYSTKDLTDILNLPISQMKSAIVELPDGAYDAIKGVAASMITSGRYDSVKKIKALDEIFDTHLLLTLAQE